MSEQTTYRIVELDGGQIKTLFHGKAGSRVLEMGAWLEADDKTVRDGSGNRWYRSGWHTLPTLDGARTYMARFRSSRRERLRLVRCKVRDTWEKEHSPHPVVLSRYLKVEAIVG